MNIVFRKLALLEAVIAENEETARIEGYATNPIDEDLKRQVSSLMVKIRAI